MPPYRLAFALLLLLLSGMVVAQDEEKMAEKFASGPKVGAFLPGPFEAYNINGPRKGRYHCVVCEFAHDPVLLAFVREPAKGEEAALDALLQKMEEMLDKHQEAFLRGAVVVLSPAALSSTTAKKTDDADKLIAEAMAREALVARLEAQAKNLKKVLLACVAEGPKGYNLSPKAGATLVYYSRLKVLDNVAFETGKVTEEDLAKALGEFEKKLLATKKKAPPAKKK